MAGRSLMKRAGAGDARRRIDEAWALAGPLGRSGLVAGAVAAVLLTGAFVFGAWHVGFGWIVKGNPRAGLFGLVLATASGATFAIGAAVARRWLTGRRREDPPGA